MIVQLQEATQYYYYYRAVLAIFPLTPDQTRAQIWPNGVRGDTPVTGDSRMLSEKSWEKLN